MKLYYGRGACSLAVRIIMNELSVDAEFESVDLKTKKTEKGDDFFQINKKGSVPVLEIDSNERLTENAVILQYLAEMNSATNLLPPKEDFKHYRVLEWLNYVATELHKSFGPLFHSGFPEERKETYVRTNIKNKLEMIDKHLANNNYLLGDDFTLPDAYLFVILTWAKKFKIFSDDLTNLSRYFNELAKRKSIETSLQQESLAVA